NCQHSEIKEHAVRVVETGASQSERDRVIRDVLSHLEALFARFPSLVGFSVLERTQLTAFREAARLDQELSVGDVSAHAWPGFEPMALGQEIVAELRELLEEHPSARALLRGYTFARTFH